MLKFPLRRRLEYTWQRFLHPLAPHGALQLINSRQHYYQTLSYGEVLEIACEFTEKSEADKLSDALDDKLRYFSFDPRCFISVELSRSHGREYEIQIIGYRIFDFWNLNFVSSRCKACQQTSLKQSSTFLNGIFKFQKALTINTENHHSFNHSPRSLARPFMGHFF